MRASRPGAATPASAWAEGAHDGYPGARHRRSIVQAAGSGTLIVDEVGGDAPAPAQLHWHFDPAWDVACESARRIARPSRATARWRGSCATAAACGWSNGDEETGLGWCSPRYGAIAPTWAARVTRDGVAPFAMLTWVGTGYGHAVARAPAAPRRTQAATPSPCASPRTTSPGPTLLRPGEPAVRATRGCTAAAYHTDARVLHVRDAR